MLGGGPGGTGGGVGGGSCGDGGGVGGGEGGFKTLIAAMFRLMPGSSAASEDVRALAERTSSIALVEASPTPCTVADAESDVSDDDRSEAA